MKRQVRKTVGQQRFFEKNIKTIKVGLLVQRLVRRSPTTIRLASRSIYVQLRILDETKLMGEQIQEANRFRKWWVFQMDVNVFGDDQLIHSSRLLNYDKKTDWLL